MPAQDDDVGVAFFRFDERVSTIWPRDAAKNVNDLGPPTGLSLPAVVQGALGFARSWGSSNGLKANELVAGSTRLIRDLTIEALVDIPWKTTNGTYILVQRGSGASTAERLLYGLKLVVTGAPGAPSVDVQMFWQRVGGTAATVAAVTIPTPRPEGYWYLWATRHWVSTTVVEVEYGLNEQSLGKVTSAHGDIGDGVGGTFYVGVDPTGPTGIASGSKIDTIRVSSEARSAEELRQIYRRWLVYPSYGYHALKQLRPPGAYSDDPASGIQRELMVEGAALGEAWALVDELLEDFPPDRAHRVLARWESFLLLAPGSFDTIATRRMRIGGFLRREFGFSRGAIIEALTPLIGPDGEIVEVRNRSIDSFTADPLLGYWTLEPNAGTVDPTGGTVELEILTAGSALWTGATRTPVAIREILLEPTEIEIIGQIRSLTNFGNINDRTGIFIYNSVNGDAHLLLFIDDAGVRKIESRRITAGAVFTTTYTPAGMPAPALWLRLYRKADGNADLGWGTDPNGPWTSIAAGVTSIANANWAGVALVTVNATGNLVAAWDDFRTWCPRARQVGNWFVYRDPATATGPADITGAKKQIEKMQPGYTSGSVIEDLAPVIALYGNYVHRDP